MIEVDGMMVRLDVVHRVYRRKKNTPQDEDGEFVKEMKVQKWFRREGITTIEQFISPRNKVVKSKCAIFDMYTQRYYPIWHTPAEVRRSLSHVNKIGY